MKTDIGWRLFVGILVVGGLTSLMAKGHKPDAYDKRNWTCAEYDVDMERNERICTRLERTMNK